MINLQVLVGRIGRDPELKYLQGGQAVLKFSVATSEHFQKNGEWQEKTTWHNVVAWGKTAEYQGAKLAKGDLVFVQGSLESRKWTGQDGQERTSYETKADRIRFLGKPNGQGNAQPTTSGQAPPAGRPSVPPPPDAPASGYFEPSSDDVPF